MNGNDKTALSYWFPRIEAAGLPVPRTILLNMPEAAQESIWAAFDGNEAGNPKAFFDEIANAAAEVGYPAFLRTDHTSGKHDWNRTCFLPNEESIPNCVFSIAEFSEINGMFGELPWTRWAVRELLPTIPIGHCQRYGDMPICREFRVFVTDDNIRCWHPYWPLHALEQGGAVYDGEFDYEAFCNPGAEQPRLEDIAIAAGEAVGGSWSVDILETAKGWFLTDMAEAHKSYHWDGCAFAEVKRTAA
jgi:hypothetical protein